jgi:hypothetical protein
MIIHLKTNDSINKIIKARKYWNFTEIYLDSKETYLFEVKGQQFWNDFFIRTDANGYKASWLKWAEQLRRQPQENWFALIGNIGQEPSTCFFIGEKLEFKPTIDGELFCYANDVPFMYWNNWGLLHLTITRTS